MSTCTKFGILIGTFTFLLSRCIINAQWISFPPPLIYIYFQTPAIFVLIKEKCLISNYIFMVRTLFSKTVQMWGQSF